MATQQSDGGLVLEGYTQASADQSRAVIVRLERWLDPFASRVMKKHPLTWEEKLDGLVWFLRFGLPMLLYGLIVRGRRRYESPAETSGATLTACHLTRAWLESLSLSAELHGELRLHVLDDAMLPPMDGVEREIFEEECVRAGIDGDIAREILRLARDSLTAGKTVPDEVAEYFRLDNVAVKYGHETRHPGSV
ncbi:hypothetical protein HY633_05635 [Candidatus Uhrbacteria bacterium]|nr:hypothetical protein [Candidatus Uhrbacteria bacterium]